MDNNREEVQITKKIKEQDEQQKLYCDTEAMLSEIPAPICVISKNEKYVISCNAAFSRMCAMVNGSNILGMPITDYFVIDEVVKEKSKEFIFKMLEKNQCFKCRLKKFDYTYIDIEVSSRAFSYNEQEAMVVYCIDLTKQNEQERKLREAALTAQEASKMKTAFLANMSHEIRTPMNVIIGFSELALNDRDISEKAKDYFNKINVSASSLLDIIDDILDITKIESGKIELEEVYFNLKDLFKHCETVNSIKAYEKKIKLHIYCEPIENKSLIGDSTRLRQVLMNLLTNAIKFTHVGAVSLTAFVVALSEDEARIRFEVRDSGIGMSSRVVEKIFEPFVQADASTTRKYGGTGLGLTIAKGIIELMGGKLVVTSIEGKGSRFSFELSFKTSELSKAEYNMDMYPVKKPIFQAEALVCEDNVINQLVIKEHLLKMGVRAVIAADGRTAVTMVKKRLEINKPFDIIFMDIQMPIMDGFETSTRIIDMGIKTPIIAMTANVMQKDRERYIKHGILDYIGKPFTVRELSGKIIQYLKPIRFEMIISHRDSVYKNSNSVIDKKIGLTHADGDEKLYMKLLKNFFMYNKDIYKEINTMIYNGDIKDAYRMVHTLKGVAGIIGALRLSEVAHVLLKSLEGEVPEYDMKQMDDFENQLNLVLDELMPLTELDEIKPKSSDAELDKIEAIELIKELEPLLKFGNSSSVDLVDEINSILSPIGEECTVLINQIENFDFEPAYDTLKDIKKKLSLHDYA